MQSSINVEPLLPFSVAVIGRVWASFLCLRPTGLTSGLRTFDHVPIPFIGSTTLHSFQTSVTMNTARIMRLQPFRQAASAVKQPLREPLLRQQARPFHQSRTMLRSKVREEEDTGTPIANVQTARGSQRYGRPLDGTRSENANTDSSSTHHHAAIEESQEDPPGASAPGSRYLVCLRIDPPRKKK